MLRFNFRLVLMGAILASTLFSAIAFAVLGADPPDMILESVASEEVISDPTLAITATGRIFVAYDRNNYTTDEDAFVLLCSDDHGRSWFEWSVLDASGLSDYRNFRMLVTSDSAGEKVVVAYSTSSEIWVSSADANAQNPIWNNALIVPVSLIYGEFELAVRPSTTGSATIAVAYAGLISALEYELHYAVSTDSGTTFTAPVLIPNPWVPLNGLVFIELDVGFGGSGATYMIVSVNVTGLSFDSYMKPYFIPAANNGATSLDWQPPVLLHEENILDSGDFSLASDPLGDEIALAYVRNFQPISGKVELQVSADGGATWRAGIFADGAEYERIQLTWTSDGPMAAAYANSVYYQLRADHGVLSEFEAAAFINANVFTPLDAQIATDPTQGNQPAMVVKMAYEMNSADKFWFNAAWRNSPGYGVSKPDWQRNLSYPGASYVGSPAVGDLDDDGLMEIVIASTENVLRAYSVGGGELVYPMGEAGFVSVPVLFDLTNDGKREVVVGGPDGRLHILDNQLRPFASTPVTFGSEKVYVSAGPVTGLAAGEIVAASGNQVHVLNILGNERPGWPQTIPGGTAVGRAAIGDIDGDGETEVVAAFDSGVIVMGSDGQVVGTFLTSAVAPSAGVSLVDIDNDGDLEIAVPMSDGTVELLQHGGNSFGPGWPYDTGTGSPVEGVSVARVLDEIDENLVFATESGAVFVVDTNGADLPGYPVRIEANARPSGAPIVAQVARPNSARPQVLVGTDTGWLYEWRAQGDPPADWPNYYDLSPVLSPVVADVDADGIAEIVLATDHKLYVLDTGTAPLGDKTRRWPMAGHDLARSGCADCLPDTPSGVAESELTTGTRIAFAGAQPNPTPGRTAFHFSLPEAGSVEFAVYDLRGRRVRSFGSLELTAGPQQMTWDGRDERGAKVASGVYVARLIVGQGAGREVLTRSVVLQR